MPTTKLVYIVTSGDLRLSANQVGWKAQEEMESNLASALARLGAEAVKGHQYDPIKEHGFLDSQRMGIDVFKKLDPKRPLIVAESVWQYSHHVLPGLITHQGPILTVANWDGKCSGLVGMLNLNGSLTKAGVKYSSLWSIDFKDQFFIAGLKDWLETGHINHDTSHVKPYASLQISLEEKNTGKDFAKRFRSEKAIMGVFDEGCMGMFNAIIPDSLLNKTGVYKERLSQSTLYAKMLEVTDEEAGDILDWLVRKEMKFNWGDDTQLSLTKEQTLEQCKMYIAALRLADEFGCDTIGIQYQQGLKDLVPASDLAEGLLNNNDRPPVHAADGRVLYPGKAMPHFNEVDECAGLDGLLTYRLWNELDMSGENTLHDIRWGEHYKGDGIDDFVWVFLISGAAPPAHFINGYAGASSERQPAMYFRLGGGSLKGISKPGVIVWSRIYIQEDALHCDLGIADVVALPEEETQRRWESTTLEWPIMHAVLKGITRDQMMSRHQANHIQVVYATDLAKAQSACRIKGAVLDELGIQVHFCGDV